MTTNESGCIARAESEHRPAVHDWTKHCIRHPISASRPLVDSVATSGHVIDFTAIGYVSRCSRTTRKVFNWLLALYMR